MPAQVIETGVQCLCCNIGKVMAVVEAVYIGPPGNPMIGPGSRTEVRNEVSFYCNHCCAQLVHPPGNPAADSEILLSIRQAEQEAEDEENADKFRVVLATAEFRRETGTMPDPFKNFGKEED